MMKSYIFRKNAAILTLLIAPLALQAGEIEWRRDFQSLTAPAGQPAEKPLLLRFFAKWCGPCRVMDARVWPDADVIEAVAQRYTPVEIDIDAPGASEFARKYNIIGVPTIVLLDRDGKEMARANFMSPEQTVTFLKEAASR